MDQVIPLSGGIDSRALLFELLKFKEAKDIHTFTFGVPGSLDYEIGNSIAESLGTNHRTILCNTTILTLENAITFKNLIGSSCNLFLTPPLKEIIPYKSMNIWSGTVIDVFFGRHFHEREARDLNQLAENYINENILTKSFRHMIDKDSLIESMNIPDLDECSLEHAADLANRQAKFVAKHLLYEDYTFSTMLGKEIMEFALSINQKFHIKQKLYIEMMLKLYPEFNNYPCKTTFGCKLSAPEYRVTMQRLTTKVKRKLLKNFKDPYVNYLDWDYECNDVLMLELSNSLGEDDLSEMTRNLIERNKSSGKYAMDVLNLLSLRIIKYGQE